jgi:hypothetical protein
MVDDKNIGFKSRKIRRNETGIYNVFVEWNLFFFKQIVHENTRKNYSCKY